MKKYTVNPFFIVVLMISSIIVKAQLPKPTAEATLAINNNKIFLTNDGSIWSYGSRGGRYFFPNDTLLPDSLKTSIIFTGGLWMTATDGSGFSHSAAQRYSGKEYYAGPIDASGNVTIASCNLWNRMFSCNKAEVDAYNLLVSSLGLPVAVGSIPANILNWPGKGNPVLSALGMVLDHEIAPFIDYNHDGIYNPIDGDFPCIKGDKAVFYVINDKGAHDVSNGTPLEAEIHVMNYVYKTTDILNNSSFYDISVLNRSSSNYTDYYLGLFVDNDLGCFNNDYVGCQPSKNMAIVYNGFAVDPTCQSLGFKNHLPIVGVKMLHTPLNNLGTQVGMSSFGYFNNMNGPQGDPVNLTQINSKLKGKWNDGSDYTQNGYGYGGTLPTNFIYPGNPADAMQWSECNNQVSGRNVPSDRRFIMNSGPYAFPSGQKLDFSYAVISKFLDSTQFANPNYDSTINPASDSVQAFYDITSSFCNGGISSIANLPIVHKARVYPNPLIGSQIHLSVANEIPVGKYDLVVSEISGKIIYHENVEIAGVDINIDLSSVKLAKGFYTLTLQQAHQKIQSRFMVSE